MQCETDSVSNYKIEVNFESPINERYTPSLEYYEAMIAYCKRAIEVDNQLFAWANDMQAKEDKVQEPTKLKVIQHGPPVKGKKGKVKKW